MVGVDSTHELRSTLLAFITSKLARDHRDVDLERESLVDTGVIDSLGVGLLVDFVQKELGVKIPDEDLLPENFDTLDALTAFVAARRRR